MGEANFTINGDLYKYLLSTSLREPKINAQLRQATYEKVEYAHMMTPPEQAQFLAFLVELTNAKRAIEVGVFTGYVSLAIAQSLAEDGELIACDQNEQWVSIGKPFWQQAGVSHKIKVKIDKAQKSLQYLLDQGEAESFDFIYIDADKNNYSVYYELALKLLRPGGVVGLDNMILIGEKAVMNRESAGAIVVDTLNKKMLSDERVTISMLPLAEGLMLARKR